MNDEGRMMSHLMLFLGQELQLDIWIAGDIVLLMGLTIGHFCLGQSNVRHQSRQQLLHTSPGVKQMNGSEITLTNNY